MTNDELPINDPDEIAVEEEFKKKDIVSAPVQPVEKTQPKSSTPSQTPNELHSEVKKNPLPQNPTPQASTPQNVPAKPVKPKQPPASPSSQQPSAPVRQQPPSQVSSTSSDIDRLRSIAKSSGLSTSMDNIDQNGGGMLFDIEVLEEDEDGRPTIRRERGVSAGSEAELRDLYAMSGQKIRIVRKYGDQPVAPAPGVSASQIPTQPFAPVSQLTHAHAQIVERTVEPPKYFNVSGVECKLENGKVYQRQWVRLAGADAESFRLVNDANNKIVPIDGKHIEQKKWVLIQESADENE